MKKKMLKSELRQIIKEVMLSEGIFGDIGGALTDIKPEYERGQELKSKEDIHKEIEKAFEPSGRYRYSKHDEDDSDK
jgi:hypothetical protein